MALLLFAAKAPAAPAARPETSAPRHWYPVWSAVLAHGLTDRATNALILGQTVAAPWSARGDDPALTRPPPIPPAAVNAYRMEERFDLAHRYVLMDRKTLNGLFRGGLDAGWNEFYRRFSDVPGIISLSAVRFSDDGERARVYVSFGCGPACGAGRIIHLTRDATAAWRPTETELVWLASR